MSENCFKIYHVRARVFNGKSVVTIAGGLDGESITVSHKMAKAWHKGWCELHEKMPTLKRAGLCTNVTQLQIVG